MKKSIVRVLALVLMLTLVITSSAAALKLQKNDKSDNVRRLQQALTQLGYYSGTVDGSFGSGTCRYRIRRRLCTYLAQSTSSCGAHRRGYLKGGADRSDGQNNRA